MAELNGLSEVLKNLNKEIQKMENNAKAGLYEAALVVKYDSVKETPIDLGNLRGSCFVNVTDGQVDNSSPSFTGKDAGEMQSNHASCIGESQGLVKKDSGKFSALIGYSANYAFWVHEMPMIHPGLPRQTPKKGLLWNGGTNKFLEKSIQKNKSRILKILEKWMKI